MRPMLYSERRAVARMGRLRRAVHRVLRAVYFTPPICDFRAARFAWRHYRRTWPA